MEKGEIAHFTQLRDDNIGLFMEEEDRPVFIACLRRDKDFQENLNQLKRITAYFGKQLGVYFALEYLLPYFTKRYGIAGTPSFLLIRKGDLIDTMLGKNPTQSVINFCKAHIHTKPCKHISDKQQIKKDPSNTTGPTTNG